MRIILIGASPVAIALAKILLERDHEVVIVERDKEKIDALSNDLDLGFIHGDGGKPAILRQAGPRKEDFLFAVTNDDQANILASLVGRSLGFERVVTKIEDAEYEHVCHELGLNDTIVPDQTIAMTLADIISRQGTMDLASLLKNQARFFVFAAREEDAGPVSDLPLPKRTRVICIYRGEEFVLPDPDTAIERGDEVILITHADNLSALRERWSGPRDE